MTNEGDPMRSQRRSNPQAKAWCHSLLAMAIGTLAISLASAQPMARAVTPVYPTAPCGRVDIAPVVQVSVGKSTVIKPSSPIKRILLGNPENSRAAAPKEPNEKTDKAGAAVAANAERRPGVADVDILLLSPTEVYVLG
jgi:pilus assembly protein CpaC